MKDANQPLWKCNRCGEQSDRRIVGHCFVPLSAMTIRIPKELHARISTMKSEMPWTELITSLLEKWAQKN